MTPVFDEFAGELDTSLAALKSIFGAVALERILAVGGGIQVPGMLGRLQRANRTASELFLSSIFLPAFRTNPSTIPRRINNSFDRA